MLRLRAENPGLRSPELAARLGGALSKPVSAAYVRQLLHRARERFAELLVQEVARPLGDAPGHRIEEELIELNLLTYCKPVLGRGG